MTSEFRCGSERSTMAQCRIPGNTGWSPDSSDSIAPFRFVGCGADSDLLRLVQDRDTMRPRGNSACLASDSIDRGIQLLPAEWSHAEVD